MENGFQGKEGQQIPEMNADRINLISERYIELYEQIIGKKFVKADTKNINARIESGIADCLKGM